MNDEPLKITADMTVTQLLNKITEGLSDNQANGAEFNIGVADKKTGEFYILAFSVKKLQLSDLDDATKH